jgi:hypothetical protein
MFWQRTFILFLLVGRCVGLVLAVNTFYRHQVRERKTLTSEMIRRAMVGIGTMM